MIDYQTMKLMHRHSDHEWAAMVEEPHHGPEAHDPERTWLRARFFRCTSCDEVVAVGDGSEDSKDAPKG